MFFYREAFFIDKFLGMTVAFVEFLCLIKPLLKQQQELNHLTLEATIQK